MQGDQIVFADFSLGHGCVLLQRATPDSMGCREVIFPFEQVAMVKLTDSLPPNMRTEMGFETAWNVAWLKCAKLNPGESWVFVVNMESKPTFLIRVFLTTPRSPVLFLCYHSYNVSSWGEPTR
jgi:hypothetical protein